MGERYYNELNDLYFSGISDDALTQLIQLADPDKSGPEKIPPPPVLSESSLWETLRRSTADVFLLSLFALTFTTVAFLKFFRSDI